MIDAGANFGLVSIMAADRIGARGRVLAFEPDSNARALLQVNVRLNRVGRRVTVVPRCLADTDGMVPFHRSEESAFSGLADTGRARIEEVESVPAQRLDTAMGEFRVSRLDAMKIDVEGFEYAVLAGGTATLDRATDPLVMLEVSAKNLDAERRGRLLEVLQDWLAKGWESGVTQRIATNSCRTQPPIKSSKGHRATSILPVPQAAAYRKCVRPTRKS